MSKESKSLELTPEDLEIVSAALDGLEIVVKGRAIPEAIAALNRIQSVRDRVAALKNG